MVCNPANDNYYTLFSETPLGYHLILWSMLSSQILHTEMLLPTLAEGPFLCSVSRVLNA
jgi:hypothetical protein